MVEKKLLATYKDGTGNFVNIGTKYTVPLFYHLLPFEAPQNAFASLDNLYVKYLLWFILR